MPKNLLKTVGATLVANGYNITPIRAGQKRPALDEWTSITATTELVARWAQKFPNGNIGIQTRHTPAIDIDITDADAAREMEDWCLSHLGANALVRIGRAPKRLLVFRAEKPFKKLRSVFVDANGTKHAIEVLGDGQQFVAFGTHPDTKKPFEWVSIESPLDVPASELPLLTHEMAVRALNAFAEMAKRRGWKANHVSVTREADDFDDDDDLLTMQPPMDDLEIEDIRDALSLLEDNEDYDRWLKVGLALFHQFQGGEKGLELWDEWSQGASNYDPDALQERWKTFDVHPDHGRAITFRTIIEWAKEAAKARAKDEFERAKNLIVACNDVDELFDKIATEVAKAIRFDHQIEAAAKLLQQRAQEIDGVKRSIQTARRALLQKRMERKSSYDGKVPEWAHGWVWLEHSDRFYHLAEHAELSVRSFNARYDIEMLTPEDKALGRAIPETRAADAALNVFNIPKVRKQVYLPGMSALIEMEGELCVNIYDGRSVPEPRAPKTAADKAALAHVQRHFAVLLPDERERNLLIDFLAFQVQYPTERVNWGVLLQGVEGAGKTWLQRLMGKMLGAKNVRPVNAQSLFTGFNGWAEGAKMIFVEEIRLHGHNRYEVLDKIKTNITNSELEITRKGRDPYTCPNVTSYVLFSNYQDALPTARMDRRYLILKTAFQTKEQIVAFRRSNPDHFANIFEAVAEYPDVLLWWLRTWKMSDEFDPAGHAPDTGAKEHMREVAYSEELDALLDIVEEASSPSLSEYLLDTTELARAMEMEGVAVPKTSQLRSLLEQAGFTYVGRFAVDGTKRRFWTRHPELFPISHDEATCAAIVRKIVAGQIEPALM